MDSYVDRLLSDDKWYGPVLEEAWNQFRRSPPADIQAVVWSLKETREKRTITGNEFERLIQSGQKKRAQRKVRRLVEGVCRRVVLLQLLEHIAFNGPGGVPRYEDLAAEERENMRRWKQLGASEAAAYGGTAAVQRRRTALETVLDEHFPGWVDGNLSDEQKQAAAAKVWQNGIAPVSTASVRKDISKLRKMRR